MIKKRYIILAVGIISVLLASLLVNNIILAQSGGEYDPWMDLNDDGIIDISDLQLLALIYATSGEAINKTELLLDLLARVEALETGGYIGAPAYDSGWVSISQGQTLTLTHNLGTTEVLVYMIGRDPAQRIVHWGYGGMLNPLGDYLGACWLYLDNTTIQVARNSEDVVWYQVRVMIWKTQPSP